MSIEYEKTKSEYQEIIELIKKIKKEANSLFEVFWTNEELAELKYNVDFLEKRIQAMMKATLHNLSWYEDEGWKQFNDEME